MKIEKEINGWKSKKLIEKLLHEAGSEHSDLKSELVNGSNPVAFTTERKAPRKWQFFNALIDFLSNPKLYCTKLNNSMYD